VCDHDRVAGLLERAVPAISASIETTEPANAVEIVICCGKVEESANRDSRQAGAARVE
jgi:hypothetical protein